MRLWILFLSAAFCLQAGNSLQAQTRSGTNSGSSGFSGTSTSGGQQRTGSSSGPSMGGGAGQSGQGQQAVNTGAGTSEGVERDFGEGFIGRSDSAGRFVGNELASPQQANQQIPDFGQRQTGNVQGGKPTRESKVRPVLRIAFPIPGASPVTSQAMETEMIRTEPELTARLTRNTQFAEVAISRQNPDTLVLDGIVHSERDRKLAEIYLRLEPGVRQVENRLTVLPGQ